MGRAMSGKETGTDTGGSDFSHAPAELLKPPQTPSLTASGGCGAIVGEPNTDFQPHKI